ncbi:DUF6783 domain-containing protein [Blautia sp. MSJ-9]
MKNHSCNLHAPICGIFCPNSVVVVGISVNSEKLVLFLIGKA